MVSINSKCMYCDSENVVRYGSNPNGKQRLKCKECKKTFQQEYSNNAAKIDTKMMIIKMALNGSGIRVMYQFSLRPNSNTFISNANIILCIS